MRKLMLLPRRMAAFLKGSTSMVKAELGTKRRCLNCNAPFFDLNRVPITCPKCNAAFQVVEIARSRPKAAPTPPVAIMTPSAPVDPIEADVALPEAEDGGEESVIPPVEEDDEIKLDELIEIEPTRRFDA